jgi:hypothetical protein
MLLLTFISCLVATSTCLSLPLADGQPKGPRVIEGAYILQLKNDGSSALANFRARFGHQDYAVRRVFSDPGLFYGLSVEVNLNETAEVAKARLSAVQGVEKVWPVVEVFLDPEIGQQGVPEPQKLQRRTCIPRPTRTSSISSTSSTSSPTNTLIPPKITGVSNLLSTHQMTDVDKLHAMGIKGKGMKVGIIDTGVDYYHPSLGGGFGPGYKIAGGYSYRNDNGGAVSIPDPLATCVGGGHGTHVAGT